MPDLKNTRPKSSALKPLLRMGGWMMVSSLTYPMLLYVDRLVLSAMVSAAATGYYITSSDLISKAQLVPIAIGTSAFPAIAACYSTDPSHAANVFRRTTVAIASILYIAALILVTLGPNMLRFWLGADFALHAAGVMEVLCLAMVFAGCDTSSSFLEAIGRPQISALWSIAELICFAPVLFVATRAFGLEGAAAVWGLKCLLNYVLKLLVAVKAFPALGASAIKGGASVAVSSALLWIPKLAIGVPSKCVAAIAALIVYSAAVWFVCLTFQERSIMRACLPKLTF